MRLEQDKKLKPRRLNRKRVCLSVFGASQFVEKIRNCRRAILGYANLFFRRAVFVRLLVFILIIGWIFSGWPQIWHFPPKIQEAQATNYLTNPSFTGGTTGWTLTTTVYDSTYYQDTAGSVKTATAVGRNTSGTGSAEQTISTSIESGSTVLLSHYWSKQCVAVNCTKNTIQVDIAKPSAPTTWVTVWSDTSIPAFGSATAWTGPSNLDVSSNFNETGQYNIRLYADLTNGNSKTAQSLAWFDNLNLDVTPPSGTLTVDIVDGVGNPVGSPSMAMGAVTFSFSYQTANGTFGVSTEKIRVENTTANPQWNLTIAANGGSTAFWDGVTSDYDFNDPTANAGDGGDADSLGGQMTMDASGGTLGGTCSATDITKGSSASFSEGVTDSITLLTAGASADTSCYWDLTGVSISQTVPLEQPADSYSINMTLTVTAL